MSIELLIILAFIAIPLIQQLLRALGQPDDEQMPEAERPTSQASIPSTEPLTVPTRVAPHPTTDATIQALLRTSDSGRPTAPVVALVRRGRRLARLRTPAELRRAIVLMTVLEPCRAIAPRIGPIGGTGVNPRAVTGRNR